MASLEKRYSKYRIVFYHGGERHQVALDTADRDEARTKKKRLEANLVEVELGRIDVPLGADLGVYLLTDFKAQKRTVVVRAQTLGEFIDEYRAHLPEGAKEASTRSTEEIHFNHLLRLIGADTPVKAITNDTLQQYVTARSAEKSHLKKPLSHTTVKKEIGSLAAVWNKWGLPKGKVDGPAPTKGLTFTRRSAVPPFQTWQQIERKVKAGESEKLWDCLFLSVSEVREFLGFVAAATCPPWLLAFLTTAAHTGARRSELMRSRLEDLDFKAEVITIREKKRDKGADGSFRHVPMSPYLKEVLLAWKAKHPGGPIAFCVKPGLHLNTNTTAQAFRSLVAGSKWEVLKGYHVLRHSFISSMAADGIDQRIIDGFVGHTTEAMRRRYTHLFPGVARKAVLAVFGEGT